jgi:ElaB/YqjD/DUF883 family membrane-anchored ribosome-binding protein
MTLEESMAPRRKKDALASVDLSDDLQKLRRDIGRLADQVSNSLQEAGDDALTEAKVQIGRIKDNVDGIISSASEKGLNATKAVRAATDDVGIALEESLHARPFATLAVAIGIGFICGVAWRR